MELFPKEAGLYNLTVIASPNITLSTSAAIMNKKGDRGSPFLSPFSIMNSSVGDPLTNTDTEAVEIQLLIQPLHLTPKFI